MSANDLNQRIGQRIAVQRLKAGMTQEDVSKALGMNNESISRLERGAVAASVPRLMELAELFDCKTGDFFLDQSTLVQDQASEIQELLNRVSPEARRHLVEQLRHSVEWIEKYESQLRK